MPGKMARVEGLKAWGRGAVMGLAFFVGGAQLFLLAGLPLPSWLPLLLGLPLLWKALPKKAAPGRETWPEAGEGRIEDAPRWLRGMGVLLVALALGLMLWGSVSSVSREWDGFVSWEARARFFGPGASFQDPWLGDPFVFAHSRSYPILQPLLGGFFDAFLGSPLGRVLLPLEYLLFLRLLFEGLTQGTRQKTLAWIGTLALALLPALINPGGGSVDSGYAELLLALLLLAAASALARRDRPLLFAAAFLLPQAKPEGLPYLFLLLLLLALLPPRPETGHPEAKAPPSLLLPACLGASLGLLLWLPLKTRLTQSGTPILVSALLGLGLPMCFWGLGLALAKLRARLSGRAAAWLLPVGALGLLALLLLAARLLFPGQKGVLAVYLHSLLDQGGRLTEAPRILGHWLLALVQVRKVGLLPLAFFFVLVSPGLRRRVPPSVLLFGALGLLATLLAFFASPMPDLDAHMRSSLGRLLLQWSGVLCLGTLCALKAEDSPSPEASLPRTPQANPEGTKI